MTNHVNPTTTNTRAKNADLHHFGLTDAKHREHGVFVTTWSADVEGITRYFVSHQKTRDGEPFGGEAKHEHFDNAGQRDQFAARITEKLYRQRERESTGPTVRGRWLQVITRTGSGVGHPQNLPKGAQTVALGDGVVTTAGQRYTATDVTVTVAGAELPKLGAVLEQGAADAADIAASFSASGELELKPLTEAGARALLDEGVSPEQLAEELANKAHRHHARTLVGRQMYAQELADNEKAAKKSKRPAQVKKAKRLARIRANLER